MLVATIQGRFGLACILNVSMFFESGAGLMMLDPSLLSLVRLLRLFRMTRVALSSVHAVQDAGNKWCCPKCCTTAWRFAC